MAAAVGGSATTETPGTALRGVSVVAVFGRGQTGPAAPEEAYLFPIPWVQSRARSFGEPPPPAAAALHAAGRTEAAARGEETAAGFVFVPETRALWSSASPSSSPFPPPPDDDLIRDQQNVVELYPGSSRPLTGARRSAIAALAGTRSRSRTPTGAPSHVHDHGLPAPVRGRGGAQHATPRPHIAVLEKELAERTLCPRVRDFFVRELGYRSVQWRFETETQYDCWGNDHGPKFTGRVWFDIEA